MDCKTAEHWLTEQLDEPLSEGARHELEVHLGGCASCRSFEEQLGEIDSALSLALKAPFLSSAFVRELQARITRESPAWSAQERLTRKQQMQHDFEAALAKLNRGKMNGWQLMTWAAIAGLGGLGAWLLWQLTPSLIPLLAGGGLAPDLQTVLRSLLPSVVFLLVGLAAAFPASTRRLLFWLEA